MPPWPGAARPRTPRRRERSRRPPPVSATAWAATIWTGTPVGRFHHQTRAPAAITATAPAESRARFCRRVRRRCRDRSEAGSAAPIYRPCNDEKDNRSRVRLSNAFLARDGGAIAWRAREFPRTRGRCGCASAGYTFGVFAVLQKRRRGGRAVECTGLENRQPRKGLVSSNLTLSANCSELLRCKRPAYRAVA